MGEPSIILRLFVLFALLVVGCQTWNNFGEEHPEEQGRRNKIYVETLMIQHRFPYKKTEKDFPPPPIGMSYLTVGATYKGDTLRILLDTVKELVHISKIVNSPVDSVSIASLVKGDSFLKLNEAALKEVYVIKPSASIDSVRLRGKLYTLNYYFDENGFQKKDISFPELAYLIDALSEWGLLISEDCYSGLYSVHEPTTDY